MSKAQPELPGEPGERLVARPPEAQASEALERYEVVVAVNLDPPMRYSQELYWLEVLAADELGALNAASEWAAAAGPQIEATGMLRRSSPHDKVLGVNHLGKPLPIAWHLPVRDDAPENLPVRDPATGLRIGFIARPEAEARWLPAGAAGIYRLVVRKPVAEADPVCLAPLVRSLDGGFAPVPGRRY